MENDYERRFLMRNQGLANGFPLNYLFFGLQNNNDANSIIKMQPNMTAGNPMNNNLNEDDTRCLKLPCFTKKHAKKIYSNAFCLPL